MSGRGCGEGGSDVSGGSPATARAESVETLTSALVEASDALTTLMGRAEKPNTVTSPAATEKSRRGQARPHHGSPRVRVRPGAGSSAEEAPGDERPPAPELDASSAGRGAKTSVAERVALSVAPATNPPTGAPTGAAGPAGDGAQAPTYQGPYRDQQSLSSGEDEPVLAQALSGLNVEAGDPPMEGVSWAELVEAAEQAADLESVLEPLSPLPDTVLAAATPAPASPEPLKAEVSSLDETPPVRLVARTTVTLQDLPSGYGDQAADLHLLRAMAEAGMR